MQDFKDRRKNLLIRSIDELIGTGLGISLRREADAKRVTFKDKDKT